VRRPRRDWSDTLLWNPIRSRGGAERQRTEPRDSALLSGSAKQSQLAGAVCGTGGTGRASKPNSRGQDTPPFLFHQLGIPVMSFLYKQTQLPPRCRSGDRHPRGPVVRNKANSAGAMRSDKYFVGKELWWIRRVRGRDKTKPISSGVRPNGAWDAKGEALCLALAPSPQRCKTKPISGTQDTLLLHYSIEPRFRSRPCCTKRSQFAGAPGNGRGMSGLSLEHIAPNEPNWLQTGRHDHRRDSFQVPPSLLSSFGKGGRRCR